MAGELNMEPIAVSAEAAAELLSVSRSTIYELFHRADFPSFKYGGRTLVSVAGLRRWVDAQTERAQAEREAQT